MKIVECVLHQPDHQQASPNLQGFPYYEGNHR